jgi:hypothetical protein
MTDKAQDAGSPQEPSEFDRFQALVKKVVGVKKEDFDREEARRKAEKKSKRGKK